MKCPALFKLWVQQRNFNVFVKPWVVQFTTIRMNNYPVDTGHKLNVHNTFRRRPGHLLNVSCAFNLRCTNLLHLYYYTPNSTCKALNRFQESYNVKYFKVIKRLKSLQKAEVYLEPKQASMVELFCEYT